MAMVHRWPCWQHLPVAALTACRYRLRIAISAYPTCIRRPIRGVPVVISRCRFIWKKNQKGVAIRWWKIFEDTFIHFDRMYERDTHTQTQHDDIGRACTASSGKQLTKTTNVSRTKLTKLNETEARFRVQIAFCDAMHKHGLCRQWCLSVCHVRTFCQNE